MRTLHYNRAAFDLDIFPISLLQQEAEKVLVVYAGTDLADWTAVADSMRDAAAWVHTSSAEVCV